MPICLVLTGYEPKLRFAPLLDDMGSKKKKSSPNRARLRPKGPPRNTSRPIDFDKDKHDNKPFMVSCLFDANIELTLALIYRITSVELH